MTSNGQLPMPSRAYQVEAYLRGALGDERFERTAAALCQPPRTTCLRVNTLATTVEVKPEAAA